MKVEVWCRPLAVVPGVRSPLQKLAEWDDPDSGSPSRAAERAWEITNAHPERLEGWMAVVRRMWDDAAGGLSFGVGDVVVVDGTRFECPVGGFRRPPEQVRP